MGQYEPELVTPGERRAHELPRWEDQGQATGTDALRTE